MNLAPTEHVLPAVDPNEAILASADAEDESAWQQTARHEFDAWSRSYDRSILQSLFFKPSHDELLPQLQLRPGMRVLDVGCGTGTFLARLHEAEPSLSLVGVDLSENMLEKARQKLAGRPCQLLQADAEHLPLPAHSVDLITCLHSFHHYPHKGRVLRELHRILRPGGTLSIVDANRDSWWGWIVFDGLVTWVEGLVYHYSRHEFRDSFEAAGFDLVSQTRHGLIAPFIITTGAVPQRQHDLAVA